MIPQCSVLHFISISCAYCLLGSYIIKLKDWILFKLTTKIEYRSLCGVTAAANTWHVYGEQGWRGHVTSGIVTPQLVSWALLLVTQYISC